MGNSPSARYEPEAMHLPAPPLARTDGHFQHPISSVSRVKVMMRRNRSGFGAAKRNIC